MISEIREIDFFVGKRYVRPFQQLIKAKKRLRKHCRFFPKTLGVAGCERTVAKKQHTTNTRWETNIAMESPHFQ